MQIRISRMSFSVSVIRGDDFAFNRIPLEQRYPEGLVYSSQTARKMKFPPKCQLKPSRASAASINHRISIERSNFPAETPSSRPLMAGGEGGGGPSTRHLPRLPFRRLLTGRVGVWAGRGGACGVDGVGGLPLFSSSPRPSSS